MVQQHSLGDVVLASIKPLVVRYCRARIGRRDESFAVADLLAKETLYAVLRALSAEQDPLLAVTYRIASEKVNKELKGEPGCAGLTIDVTRLPERQREILVLRAVCGLSAEQTAEAIGSTVDAVRIAQHHALTQLRKTASPDIPATRLGHGADYESLRERC
ncbi:RNA polymerase sigma-70 factor (ECF subfamily) [Kibdelosporangium banguiense]|uniref:RNA polymerase sigma-70 factor (ECF subfamily) n=1 Tax=Kibdelosporangium banguiense TaxID=1365924 RepID=A0ABS4T7D4_9PSEU|nr:sigma factor-like helix-turn-helix DNA-binding protein [Kibdelosporangium banguiense]MBP2320313.1 RNA polymerase sigma-70 factor (ECF subfamily) [Kibdelosporangium banguiense]